MRLWQRFIQRLRGLVWRNDTEQGLDEELQFHIDMEIGRNRERGLSDQEARRVALRDFGGIEVTKEAVRDTVAIRWFVDFIHDLHFSARVLFKRPAFSVATVLTISVAAATTALAIAAIRQILWTPLPYAESDRIVVFYETDLSNGMEHQGVSPGNVLEWQRRTTAFDSISVAEPWGIDTTVNDRPMAFSAWAVSNGFMETMGLKPMLGRTFDPAQYELDNATEILVTYQGWKRIFGSDQSIVGTTLESDQGKLVIVGVLPADVDLPSPRDFWLPRAIPSYHVDTRSGSWITGVGRLKAGHSLTNGRADIERVAAALSKEYPESNGGAGVTAHGLKQQLLGGIEPAVKALGIAAVCFFLAACATLASMFLTRLYARSNELSIRKALGAHHAVLIRQGLAELLIICVIAGCMAIFLTVLAIEFLTQALPDNLPLLSDLQLDSFAVVTAFAISPLIIVCCAVLPLLKVSRRQLATLNEPTRSTGNRAELRARSVLITLQVCVAVIVLVGATLMIQSLGRLLDSDIGFDPDSKVSLQVLTPIRLPQRQLANYFEELLSSIANVSGVDSVAGVSALPFHPRQIDPESRFEHMDEVATDDERLSTFTIVTTPGYFDLMGIAMRDGREFSKFDGADSKQVAIVNQLMADRYWPDGDPIGKRINASVNGNPVTVEIVGIVENTRPFSFDSPSRPELFVPLKQSAFDPFTLVAKTDMPPETLIPALQAAIWKVAPQQAVYHTATVPSLVSKSAQTRSFATRVLGAFAFGAVGLAILGIYSLMNYTVTLRKREFGIRMAIGATPASIQKAIARRTIVLTLAGVIPGVLLAALVATRLRPLLYGIEPHDIQTYLIAGLLIATVSITAALIPAWRASRHSVASLLNAP